MPLAYQSSSLVSSLLGTIVDVGIPLPSSVSRMALTITQSEPCPPVLKPHRPLRTTPPSLRFAVPVGEKTPLILGSPDAKTSSCVSSGKTPTSHPMALRIVATHELDGQPRATSARTSHCVWKSAS